MEGNNLNNMPNGNVQPNLENDQQPIQTNPIGETLEQPTVEPIVEPLQPEPIMEVQPVVEPAPQVSVEPVVSEVVPTTPIQPEIPTVPAAPVQPTQQPLNNVPSGNLQDGVESNMPNNKKKKPMLLIILGIVVLAAIIVAVVLLLTNKDKDKNKDNDKKEEVKEEVKEENNPTTEVSWNGVYENEQGTIRLFELEDGELVFDANVDGSFISGTADIEGNKAEGEIFDTYTFVLNGDALEFSSSDEEITGGTFTKVKDYSKEDYYADNYGDASFLETGLNGVFESNGISITIYQTKADKANIIITKEYSTYQGEVDVVNGAILYQDEFFDDIDTISASITGDTLVITAASTDQESLLNEVSGSYPRTKTLTVEDILSLGM